MRIFKPRLQAMMLAFTLIAQPAMAQNVLPSGGTVVSGTANISQSGANQVINQTSGKAIINWQDFSIGAGNSVRVNQPSSSSILLNRVVGSNPSNILGNLSSNGQIFLVNPFGVYFGAGATVDVGGLLATTLSIGNDDFMAGRFIFNRNSLTDARREVINQGVLKARDNGYIVLAGDYAANRGVIQAKLGTVALASGNQMTLDIQGDNLIAVAVNEKTVASLSGVDNSGQILADGGRAIMTASVARDLTTAAVNNSGLIQAQTAVEKNGEIYLSSDGGNTINSGTLDASGKSAGQTGGMIQVLGDKVALTDNALLDASGDAGGGKINVGGNFQGNGPLVNSQTNYVGQNVQIKADALKNGNGGNVVIWSDDWTRYYGNISAKGGSLGGDGGNVEVSGKQVLAFNGKVNTLAANGKAGTLLLDPSDIEVVTSVAAGTGDLTGTSPFQDATDNGGTSKMTVGDLETALGNGNVIIRTTTTDSSDAAPKGGTITIDDGAGGGVQWGAATSLTLQADNQIIINSNVEGSNGGSSIIFNAANGAIQKAGTVLGANSLLITGAGNWDLAGVGGSGTINSYNNINVFAANISGGLLRFSNNKNFTVGTVSGVNGITHTNGNTQLYLDRNSGKLTLAQGINSSDVYIRASGGVNQAGGAVIANSLALAGGAVNMTQSGNDLNTIAANINGTFAYTDNDDLKIGSAFSVNGITTSNHDVTIKTGNSTSFDATKQPNATNPASLVLNETVNAGNGTVRLTVGQGGVYQRHDVNSSGTPLDNGAIKAAALLMKGSSSTVVTPYVLTNANNRINTLAGNVNGSISYAGTSYSGNTTTVGSVDATNGLSTTSNTVVSSTTNSDGSVTDSYNPNDISLSIGGNLNINQNITASTTNGSDSVSIGIGGDYTAKTAAGVRITADTLGVFGDDSKGTFLLKSKVSNIAASGGKLMVIDNSDYTDSLTALGIGANSSGDIDDAIAAGAAATSGSSATVSSSDKPVGDFYLTTGGALSIIKLNSKGQNLMLRSTALDILLTATTADNARIMLQPFDLTNTIGINNANEPGFTPNINYDAATLLKFTNPVSTFYIGTPQESIMADANVPTAAKNTLSGDVHIGYDGAFNLGYRSLSAQTTGNMVAYNVGPLYNLRLAAPNLTINSFNTIGDQMHFFSNNLNLPGASSAYVNGNKPKITLRSLNDETIWIGKGLANKPYEPHILPQTLAKLPDYSTIIISGSANFPFPNGGAGHGDIHIPWDNGIVSLGNRKLILSTGNTLYTYNATPTYTKENNGGTSGGLWRGCENLSDCMGSNPSPYPNPDTGNNGGGGGGGGDGSGGYTPCANCPPAPPNVNPYPPTNSTPGDNGNINGNDNGNNGNNNNNNNNNDNDNNNNNNNIDNTNNNNNGNNGGDGGGFSGGGGDGDGSNNNSNNGNGSGDGTGGDGSNTSGNGGGGDGTGSNDSGLNGDGSGNGGDGGGDGGGSMNGGGNGDGSDSNGSGANSGGTGSGGDGNGSDGSGNGNDGSNNGGNGGGDGGTSTGSGGDGDGSGGNGNGNNGNGSGDGGDGSGSGGDGNGAADSGAGGDGSGNAGDGGGDGGASTGSGGDGDGSGGNGNGNNGNGSGDGSDGSGSGGAADGDGGSGAGQNGDGSGGGDGGNSTDSGGSADGTGSNNGDGGNGNQNTDQASAGKGTGNGDGNGDAGAGSGSGGKSDGDSDGDGGKGQTDGNDPGVEQAPSFDISCDDLQQDSKKQTPKANAQANGEMVAIKRDGVKMHTPCQKENPKDKK